MTGATPGLRYYKAAWNESGPSSIKESLKTYLATPLGVASYPASPVSPVDWVRAIANVQSYKEHETGGHFPAVECPETFVADLREWFGGEVVKRVWET